ncbi:PTS sugar transporter subunit IIC [Rhodoglobus sp. NPDC076762]
MSSRGGDQVSTVLVLCGAGASSTFLAHALRRQSTARGLEHTFTPASVSALSMPLSSVDVVLVSSHVSDFFDQAAIAAQAIGAQALQLPALNFNAAGADIALDLLDSLPPVTTESSNDG